MNFAEANARYELVKQRFLDGELTDDQYDVQLRDLMVLDDAGRWWAKSRENGDWHYYDAAAGAWVTDIPPLEDVLPLPDPAPDDAPDQAPQEAAAPAGAQLSAADPAADPEPDPATADVTGTVTRSAEMTAAAPVERPTYTSQGPLPKWAAVAPAHASLATPAAPAQPAKSGQPARPASAAGSGHAAAPAVPYNAHDFAPLPELGTGQKIVFYALAFLVPLLGLLLFAAYRTKPAAPDRAAARIFLVLGVISVILYGLCGVLLLMTEAFLLAAGT